MLEQEGKRPNRAMNKRHAWESGRAQLAVRADNHRGFREQTRDERNKRRGVAKMH
jgi:hypothetical protein